MNFIATAARRTEYDAKAEIAGILNGLGDDSPDIAVTEISGILTASTSVSYADFADAVREKIADEPWSLRYSLRIIPVCRTVRTDISEIVSGCSEYGDQIGGETYRITIEKRHSGISSSEIISRVADAVSRSVSLESPAWEIIIEVLGARTGLALARPCDTIRIAREKRVAE